MTNTVCTRGPLLNAEVVGGHSMEDGYMFCLVPKTQWEEAQTKWYIRCTPDLSQHELNT